MISLVAAIGKNNELGKGNDLVWKLPADLRYFKKITSGHTIVMGRKTFESLPNGPLPKRRNIVITRDKNYKEPGIEVAHSLEEALRLAQGKPFDNTQGEQGIFIIGGGEIFKQAMPLVDTLHITHIEAVDKDADVFFPEIIPVVWNEVSREEHKKDSENPFDYTFSVYEKFL